MRDEAVEEGYITRAQRETTGPERKRKRRWGRRAWRKSLALILYGRFISSPPSLALVFGQSLGCLYEYRFNPLLPPVH